MAESNLEFLKSLREEVIHHKEKRATFVLQKLLFVTALFGVGTIEPDWINTPDFHWLLYSLPFISLVFDVYIFAEDYKIKRIGTFTRIYRYASSCERDWERFINQHREPKAVFASFVLTIIVILASVLVLLIKRAGRISSLEMIGGLAWIIIVIILTLQVFRYYRRLPQQLPQPHLLKEQIKELLSAPKTETSSNNSRDKARRDKVIVALLLNTGIEAKDVATLTYGDLNCSSNGPLKVKAKKRCAEREIPYWRPHEVLDAVKEYIGDQNISNDNQLFPDLAKLSEKKIVKQICGVLKQYPIVIEGVITVVELEELQRTYARGVYEEGIDLVTIQQYLGCDDIKSVLGYIGPIEARRDGKDHSSEALTTLSDIATVVKAADHQLTDTVYRKVSQFFLECQSDSTRMLEIEQAGKEYSKREFFVCVNRDGQPVIQGEKVIEDFRKTIDHYPEYEFWFQEALLPDNRPTLLVARWLCHSVGFRHRVVHLFLDHPELKDCTLLQVRAIDKAESPGCFDLPAAGHVSGIEALEVALRAELAEELGLRVTALTDFVQLGSYAYLDSPENRNVEHRTVFYGRLSTADWLKINADSPKVAAIVSIPIAKLHDMIADLPESVASGLRGSFSLYLKHRMKQHK
ncbi:MAG: tyrosine-type recombinase/integrase [Anaerolineae bacterium]|nr:tyrosine-type recombinase/integrase [Anaerolineae bacterium]